MWRKVVPAVVVLAAIVVAIAWKLHGRGGASGPASGGATGSASVMRTGPRPAPAPAALAGHVTKQGGGAIAGATVAIARANLDMSSFSRGGGEDTLIVVTTDASGAWTADKVAPGRYAITATASGFLPARKDAVTLAAGQHVDGIDLALAPGGTVVRGTVSDVGGGGIPGARISARADVQDISAAFARSAPYSTLSGPDGKYELALPDGPYQVSASHDDYTGQSHALEVRGKPLVADFTLVPGAVVRGQVIARDSGKPVPGAMIEAVSGRRRFAASASATADADGRFVLRHLSSGNLAITAAGYGYASTAPTEVAVGIGEQIDGVRVVLDRAFTISGRVVNKGSQQGIAGVMIGAGSFTSGQSARALEPSDADGAFQIVGVRPGSYIVFAISEDKMPELGKNIDVTTKDITDVVIEMSSGATLTGRVEPPSKASIGLSLVGEIGIGNIMELMRSAFVHAETDATGAFVLRHVPAGKFTLVATTAEGPGGKLPVTVADTDQNGLVVALETRASISGRVEDTNHAPVAGTRVTAQRLDAEMSMASAMQMMKGGAITADDGSFKITGLEAGKYTVLARDQDDFSVFFGRKDKKDDSYELAAGAERTGVVITVEAKDGVIRGTVIGSDGKAAGDAWVSARRELDKGLPAKTAELMSSAATTQPVLTSGDGKFVLDHLRKGNYTLVADGPRGASRGEKNGVATGDNVTITLASLGTLTGHVMARAAPVAAYDLTCRGPAGRVDRHVDAADGGYLLEHLAPGHYDCSAEADAGTATGASDVPTGPAQLELSLVPWASIVGTVVNVLTGAPIAGITPILTGDTGKGFAAAFFGNGPITDPAGKFTIDRVAAGSGSVSLFSKTDITKPLATRSYTATQGQQVDLGTIKVIPPRDGDAGTLGMATEVQGDALAVTLVQPGGPAAAAGVVVGDKITAIDGKSIADLTSDIAQKVLSSGIIGAGMQVVLTLERGATVTLTAAKW